MTSMGAAYENDRNRVFELRCAVATKHWGKIGSESEVARLLECADADGQFTVDPATPYAELWMGTHPSGPSRVAVPGERDTPLADWIHHNPSCVGDGATSTPDGRLPFLLKVLSVRKALSIQAHPDKALAAVLHERDPHTYVDTNHKPEMVIALGDFHGLCGFRPIHEVAKFVQDIEELRVAVGPENAISLINASRLRDRRRHADVMKTCFSTLMGRHDDHVHKLLAGLVDRVKVNELEGRDTGTCVGDILLKLDMDFPGDVGALAIYFLNVVRLRKGEAIFFGPNVPHAYLGGDCIECMASSDNVVRAGLTPNHVDLPLFMNMVDCTSRPVRKLKLKGKETTDCGYHITTFAPPITDFEVAMLQVPDHVTSCVLSSMDRASIVICIDGTGHIVNRTAHRQIPVMPGSTLFISANEEVALHTAGNGMLLFRAYAG